MPPLRTLLLDLDDTLYPANSGLWEAIGDRIEEFMIAFAGIPQAEAPRLRQAYFERYGTSLNGLRLLHGIDPHRYLAFVHDVPLPSFLTPNPRLRRMLERLHRPPAIFTNADSAHARRVLQALGLEGLTGPIIDIVALGWINKPRPEAYRRALALVGETDPRLTAVVDDQARNLLPAGDLGMTTVLVGPPGSKDGIDHVIQEAADLLEVLPGLGRTVA